MDHRIARVIDRLAPHHLALRSHLEARRADVRTLLRMGRPWQHHEQFPRSLTVETTSICNADCIFCAYSQQDRFRSKQGVMSDALYERILREYAELGGERFSLTPLVGDPLVDPKIVDRIRQAVARGFEVDVYTNGILLHRIDLEALVESGLAELHLSVSPFDEESHRLLYQTRFYRELVEGVVRLIETRNRLGAALRLVFEFRSHLPLREVLERPDFRDRIAPLLRESERRAVKARITSFNGWGGLIRQEHLAGQMRMAVAPALKHRPCAHTFNLQVLFDGTVRACPCFFGPAPLRDTDDGLRLGHLDESSLRELWLGERLHALRRRFVAGDLPGPCRQCTIYMAV